MKDRIVCASGVELLMDHLEGALPEDLRTDLEAHVATCPRCTAFVASSARRPASCARRRWRLCPPISGNHCWRRRVHGWQHGGVAGIGLCRQRVPLQIVTSDAFSQEKRDHLAALGAELTLVRSEGGLMFWADLRDWYLGSEYFNHPA